MYDKHGIVLRIETTINNVSELKHYRTVEHRDGTSETKYAPIHKTIYSLGPLGDLLRAANGRYLDFLSDLDDPARPIVSSSDSAPPPTQGPLLPRLQRLLPGRPGRAPRPAARRRLHPRHHQSDAAPRPPQ